MIVEWPTYAATAIGLLIYGYGLCRVESRAIPVLLGLAIMAGGYLYWVFN